MRRPFRRYANLLLTHASVSQTGAGAAGTDQTAGTGWTGEAAPEKLRLYQEEAAFYQQASAAGADLETRKPMDRLKNLFGIARLIETSADMAKALANPQEPADPHQNRLMVLFAEENGGLTFAFPPPPAAVRTGGGNGAVAFSDGASLAITAGSGTMAVQT